MNQQDLHERRISECVQTRSCFYGFWRKIGRVSRKSMVKVKLPGKCFRANNVVDNDKERGGTVNERKDLPNVLKNLPVVRYEIEQFESTEDDTTREEIVGLERNGAVSRNLYSGVTKTGMMESITEDSGDMRFGEFESVNSCDLHTIQLEDSVAGSSS